MAEGTPQRKVLDSLDSTWVKLAAFAHELSRKYPQADLPLHLFECDVLTVIPDMQTAFGRPGVCEKIQEGDVEWFRAQAPVHLQAIPFEEAEIRRAFLFAKVFMSLLDDWNE